MFCYRGFSSNQYDWVQSYISPDGLNISPDGLEATDLKQLPLREWWANMYLRWGRGDELPVAHPA